MLATAPHYSNQSHINDGTSRHLSYRKPLTFYVMGDAPYTASDRDRFPLQVKRIHNGGDFIVHVGDMKGVDSGMSDGPYSLVSDALIESKAPCFIVPGDNDYYDCSNPEAGWKRWERYFMQFHAKHWASTKPWVSNVSLNC